MKTILYFLIFLIFLTGGSCASKTKSIQVPQQVNKLDPAAYDYLYSEGLKQKLLGNGGDALRYFEQCVKLDPQRDGVYFQMAQIVLASGDLESGKKYAKNALSLDERNIWYIMMLSSIYYQEGNIDSAVFVYEKSVEYYPNKINFQIALANLYTENKDYNKALKIFEKLENEYGVNETTTLPYIMNFIEAGRYDEALRKTEELIKMNPAGIEYYALLAEIYREKGDRNKAEEVYVKLLKENPDNVQIQLSISDFLLNEKRLEEFFVMLNPLILNTGISREEKISLFARLIDARDLKKEEIEAIIFYLMVLEATYPDDEIIPLLRPEFLDKIERKREAADRLEEIIAKNAGNYFAWEKILLLYLQMEDFKQLMIRGEECATRFNRSYLVKLLYANGALESKMYEIALDELRKAQILAGENEEYLMQVLVIRADVYYRMKDFSNAFMTFDEALELDPDDITMLNNYAYYLAEQNMRLKEAEIMAKKVIEKEGDNATFLDTYAWVLYKRGKVRDAAKIMESIISKGKDFNAEYFEHYGFMLKSMKKCSKAIENWSMAMDLDSTKAELKGEIENCRKQ